MVNGQLLHFLHHGRVQVAPAIERFDGRDVHFADGTICAFDTIVFATGFKVTLPFLDPALLEWRDGVPLRVAGMTVRVGVDGLYFVGLAAPRGPQLPVYSAQARLVAKPLTAERPIAFGTPEARIDIPRHECQRDMDRTHRRVDRALRRAPRPAARLTPVTVQG